MNERLVDLETVVDLSDIIDALQDLSTGGARGTRLVGDEHVG